VPTAIALEAKIAITINAINLPIDREIAAIIFTSKNIVLDKNAFKIFQPQNTRLDTSLT
jgi:hypothetical protein